MNELTDWKVNPRSREIATTRVWADLAEQARRMRRLPTPAENTLWRALRGRRLQGLKFRRQHAIGRFIVDFYCVRASLVIEVDGSIHDEQQAADLQRDAFLESMGLTILRFSNDQVMDNLECVIRAISAAIGGIGSPSPQEGEGVGG